MAHAWDLRSEVKDARLVEAVSKDYAAADLSPLDRALCDFAVKLTQAPGKMCLGDIDALRARGLSDRAVSDAVQVISFFNYINRVADGLGVDLEPEMPKAPVETSRSADVKKSKGRNGSGASGTD